jgi:hypothetical protein
MVAMLVKFLNIKPNSKIEAWNVRCKTPGEQEMTKLRAETYVPATMENTNSKIET